MKLELFFNDDYFDEEYRCEYLVSAKQKKIWACELDLANKLIEVCKKYDIKLMAYAGTLLGAIRHKGFIPWDDDMDFCMSRKDFYRLLEISDKEFSEPYFLQTALSDRRFFCGYARLRNSTTTAVIENHNAEYNCGIFIDIFVLDGFVDDETLFHKQIKDRDLSNRLAKLFLPVSTTNSSVRKVIKGCLRWIAGFFTTYEASVRRYWDVLGRYNGEAEKVTFMTHPLNQLKKYYILNSDFNDIVDMPFENIVIPVPKNYERILNDTYGDYMKFPPVEERGKWHQDQIVFEPDIAYKDYFKNMQ